MNQELGDRREIFTANTESGQLQFFRVIFTGFRCRMNGHLLLESRVCPHCGSVVEPYELFDPVDEASVPPDVTEYFKNKARRRLIEFEN